MMGKEVNLRLEECQRLSDQMKEFHRTQRLEFQHGLSHLETLLSDSQGFHANQTNEKMTMVIEMIRQQIEPRLNELFEEGEIRCLRFLEQIMTEDQEKK